MALLPESEEPIALEGNVAHRMLGIDHDGFMTQPRTGLLGGAGSG